MAWIFFYSYKNAKKGVERLYSVLAIFLEIDIHQDHSNFHHEEPNHNSNFLDTRKSYTSDSLFSPSIHSYNYKQQKKGVKYDKFYSKSKFYDFLNNGFLELLFLDEIGFVFVVIIFLIIINDFLAIGNIFIYLNSDIITNLQNALFGAVYLRYAYILCWLFYWGLIKQSKSGNYFNFSMNIEDITINLK